MVSQEELKNILFDGDLSILDATIEELNEKGGHLETKEKSGLISFIDVMAMEEIPKEKEEELIKALVSFIDRRRFLCEAKRYTSVKPDQILTPEQLARFSIFSLTISTLGATPEYASCVFEPEDLIICLHVEKLRSLLERQGIFERAVLAIKEDISFAKTLAIISMTIKA
jgi:hypothetical protein